MGNGWVKRIRVTNIKGVREITIYGNQINELAGGNGAGKSTVLDAVEWALAGAKNIQDVPVRNGETKGSIELSIDDYEITRIFEDGETRLVVRGVQGGRFAQTDLNKFVSTLAFDPTEFIRLDKKKQAEVVRRIAGYEWSSELDQIDSVIAGLFEDRKIKNKMVKDMGSIENNRPEKVEEIDVSALMLKLREIDEYNAEQDTIRGSIVRCDDIIVLQNREIVRHLEEIEKLKAKISECENKVMQAQESRESFCNQLQDKQDKTPIIEAISLAASVKERVLVYKQWEKEVAKKRDMQEDAGVLTYKLEEVRKRRVEHMASAKLPVTGLSFNDDGEVTYDGLPLDQLSDGEKIDVCVSLTIGMNSKFRIAFVQHGESLDSNTFDMVKNKVLASGMQLWIATTGKGHSEDAIVIESGELKVKNNKGEVEK